MATFNETVRAVSVELTDQNGAKTTTTGDFTVSAHVRSDSQQATAFFRAKIIYNLATSSYASSKKLKTPGTSVFRWKSKSLSITDSPDRGGYPPGSTPDAVLAFGEFWPAWEGGLSYYDALSRFSGNVLPKDYTGSSGDIISISSVGLTGSQYAYTTYTGDASMVIAGASDGTYYPRKTVTWEDIVPVVSGMAPSSGAFVDETQAKTFNWTVGNVTAYDGTSVLGTSVFKWRANGITHSINANTTSVTVPAGTFPNGTIEWCVVHTTTDGISNVENWQTFTTVETTPEAPSDLSPRNEVVNGNEATIFSWHHNISTGSAQTKADLQYNTNGSTWSTLATVTGSTQSATIPAGTFAAGEKMWRVRTYNTDNTPGPYATASIIVKARPLAPSIDSITGVPLATITWSAADQAGFRIVFIDSEGNTYDSGERYGSVNTFTSPILLAEGEAIATVYVGNSSGLWNSTTIQFGVANDAAGSIVLDGTAQKGKAVLSWENDTESSVFYVLKNGKPITKLYDTSYEDKTANGTAVYEVLAMNADSTFVRSNAVTITTRIFGAQVFDYEHDGELIDMFVRRDSIFELSKSRTANTSYYHFSGNTFPTAYTELHQNETISFTITKENTNVEAIFGLVGALCCIKDKTGAVAFGILDSVSENTDRYSDLTLSFTRTEDEEGVAYEA